MSDEKPETFRREVPDLSKHAEERATSSYSSISVIVEMAVSVIFVILVLILIPFLLTGLAIWDIINRLRGKKAEPESLSDEELAYLLEDANQGEAEAQYSLGYNYDNGSGVIRDFKEATKWYRMAAQQGHARAQYSLGCLYETGYGDARNYEEAAEWYRMAAQQGHAHAQYNLGKMFANGYGVEQDDVQAWMWCSLAQEFNYMSMGTDHTLERQIDKILDELKGRMSDSEIEKARDLVENSFKATS